MPKPRSTRRSAHSAPKNHSDPHPSSSAPDVAEALPPYVHEHHGVADLEKETDSKEEMESEEEGEEPVEQPVKRGRGRPRKHPVSAAPTGPPPKRQRGRPAKATRPGRPPLLERANPDAVAAVVGPEKPYFDAEWTEEDESWLLRDDSQEILAFANITKQDTHLLEAWRVCTQRFRCSPFALLSPLRGLTYQTAVRPEGSDAEPVLWDQEFCRQFSQVLAHPIWRRDVDVLTMVLQYAVICRTDDRRLWKMPPTDSFGPLAQLKTALESSEEPLAKSIHEMHEAARTAAPPKTFSPLSDLMLGLGKDATASHPAEHDTTHQGLRVYAVTTYDLIAIRSAIHGLGDNGVPMFATTEESLKHFHPDRKAAGIPHDYLQLRSFHQRAWLHEQRRIIRALRKE
ncbi:hypothetical protein FALBO_5363 [Fusarium albosuccineum]|uniref:Uncharacterized protein n=1 Tax=Fusarium albosuccineum TaxID=1237068 RepID=A0A8H4LGN1_9HYPO|nr:hypothetical protein FALBO_5363 [Fusarium albosuccineum]